MDVVNRFVFSFLFLSVAALCAAQNFRLEVGSPVAAGEAPAKAALFAFRTLGCAQAEGTQVSASAEELVSGERRSVALTVRPMQTPGVYAVYRTWPSGGFWLVSVRARCGDSEAGVVVPFISDRFVREAVKPLPRAATPAEIDETLKALSKGDIR